MEYITGNNSASTYDVCMSIIYSQDICIKFSFHTRYKLISLV